MQESFLPSILVVDDSAGNPDFAGSALDEHCNIFSVDSVEKAHIFLAEQIPDLILLNSDMPGMDILDAMEKIASDTKTCDIPVIFLSDSIDPGAEALAFSLGAVDYMQKPLNTTAALARIKRHLDLSQKRIVLGRELDSKVKQLEQLQDTTIELLANMAEFRDRETDGHVRRAVAYVCAIMDNIPIYAPTEFPISAVFYDDVKKSVPLHDIGNIGIPDSILLKPGKLIDSEYEAMKRHVADGVEILESAIKKVKVPSFLDTALDIVLTHHEKWDGSGYPQGLRGTEIPLVGRMMALADVYDALTSTRPYRPAMSHAQAMRIIADNSGTHFDPVLVNLFVNIQDKIEDIARDIED